MTENQQPRRRCCEAADGTQRQMGRGRGALLEPMILAALAGAEQHGYDLIRAIESMTNGAVSVDPGGVYRTLRRLEEERAVVSEWVDTGSGPQRREYTLTAEGHTMLLHWLEHLRERQRLFSVAVAAVEQAIQVEEHQE